VQRSSFATTLLFLTACGGVTPPQTSGGGGGGPTGGADKGAVSTPRLSRPAGAVDPVAAAEGAPETRDAGAVAAPEPGLLAGPLARPTALRRFFEALARLDDGAATGDVHVVQFGDSHTAADVETATVRRALQGHFGDGGRGFVAIGKPWKSYYQEGVRTGMTREWSPEHGKLEHGQFTGDGQYGLQGVAIAATKKNARAWSELSTPSSRIELSYLEQPMGGSIELSIDGVHAGRVSTRATVPGRRASAWRTFDVTEGAHRVEAAMVGDGEVRLLGLGLDRASVGVTLDAMGINGARVTTPLQWNEAHMTEQLRHRAPDLVILAYGTNEAGDSTTAATYERQLVDLLGRVARAAPTASCLLLGPPDRAIGGAGNWVTSPKLLEVIESQKKVAEAAGCAYYSQLDAMGGPGSMTAWAAEAPPRGNKDHVHLTRDGYVQLGTTVANDVVRAYVAWRAETGRPPAPKHAPPPPSSPPVPAGSASLISLSR
jgi:lysophospholipase L1-like esterase